MSLESILGRLHALLLLEPDETELVLDVVDHLLRTFGVAAIVIFTLGRGVGTLELEGLLPLDVLAAVGLPQDTVDLLDVEGVGEQLVSGEDVLEEQGKKKSQLLILRRLGLFATVASPLVWSGLVFARTL